jgi:hypothetical protein
MSDGSLVDKVGGNQDCAVKPNVARDDAIDRDPARVDVPVLVEPEAAQDAFVDALAE